MYLIDSHTHLFDSAFDEDRYDVVSKAITNDVKKMVLPCCSAKSLEGINNLCKKFGNNCFPTAGLHPEDIGDNPNTEIDEIFSYKFCKPIVAVGEIGIDKHYVSDNIDIQMQVFETQVAKALSTNLPIIVHCREAHQETFEVLEHYKGKIRGIFHCFSGDAADAMRVLDFGFYFGIGGVVTFKKSGAQLAELVKNDIPLNKIVLETDSPYLAPVPYRGHRNDSSMIPLVAHKIAELKNISFDEVASVTTRNSEEVFGI